MKASPDLFELIKSLNKSEKRYIQLNAVHAGDKDYMTLFAAIDKQDEYDEAAIKKKLSKERFIKRLPAVKNYLYEFIMKSLAAYYADLSADSRIRHFLNYSEILFDKKLFGQSIKALAKAKKIATKYDKKLALFEIIQAEQLFLQSAGKIKEIEASIEPVYKESKQILEKEDNFLEYKKLYYHLYTWYQRKGLLRDGGEIKKLTEFMQHPLLDSEEKALAADTKRTFSLIHILNNYMLGNVEGAHNYIKRLTELAYPSDDLRGEIKYLGSLRNLLSSQYTLKKYDEMELTFKKLKQITPSSESSEIIMDYCLGLELMMYVNTGRVQKAKALLSEAELAVKKIGKNIRRAEYMLLQFNIASTYFFSEEYNKSLFWINNILNNKYYSRKDIITCVKIMNLLVHFELGNSELLEYLVRGYTKEAKENLFLIEHIFIDFTRSFLSKGISKKELLPELHNLKRKITDTIVDDVEKNLLDTFNSTIWIDSKLENKKMETILQINYE